MERARPRPLRDPYGMDIHAQHQRAERFKGQVSRWLEVTGAWLDGKSRAEVAREDDVALGNWYMFHNAVVVLRHRGADRALADVVQVLRDSEESGGPQEHALEPETEWNINELSFVVAPRGQDTGEADTGSSRLEGADGGG